MRTPFDGVRWLRRVWRRKEKVGLRYRGVVTVQVHDENGVLTHEHTEHNIVVNAGLDYAINVALIAATQITAWYIGLMTATPAVVATDTMASHGGFTESAAYTEGTRRQWNGADAGTGAVDNNASAAVFSINVNGTVIGGIFLSDGSAKTPNAGHNTGTLFSGLAFTTGNITINSGSTLTIKYALSAVDDGV